MTSPLENLSGAGKPLRQEAPDAKEFANLRQSGLKRLADAENRATERHLLYAACTRPRDHLLVTGVTPASEFLQDLGA